MDKNKKTILCCDDDQGILEVLQIIIEEKGLNVITTYDGQSIPKLIKEYSPVAIFLDLWMPKVNGDILGKELKDSSEFKDIPLVLVSAHKDLEQKMIEIGANYYVRKPFDINEIEEIIAKLV